MNTRGWSAAHLCKRGHDITAEGVIGVDASSGKRFCRPCRNWRKLESLKTKQRYCRWCKVALPLGQVWAFCSVKCDRSAKQSAGTQIDVADALRTRRMLLLYEQLERASMSWEREEIRAKIAQAMAAQETDR